MNNNDSKMGRPMAIVPDQISPSPSLGDAIKNIKDMFESLVESNKDELGSYEFPDVPNEEMQHIGYMPYPDYVCKFIHENHPSVENAWAAWYEATKRLYMYHRVMYSNLSDEMMRCSTKETDEDTFMVGRVLMATDATVSELVTDSHTIVEDWQSYIINEADQHVADRMERHVDQEHQDDTKLRDAGRKEARKLRIVAPLNHRRRMMNYRLNILREKVPQEEIDALEAETREALKDS